MPVRVLGFHAAYACRHSGACCSSGWPIPVEHERLIHIERAVAAGTIGINRTPPFIYPADAPADVPALAAVHDGRCVFHTTARRCSIHGALGHRALPLACRQFPRVTLHDPRGTSVTLSHYCPTASAMLESGGDMPDILFSPSGFPEDGEYVGLDARDALPPLLHRDLLMDWESWWRLEELAVATLLHGGGSAGEALALLRGAVARLGFWRPGGTQLIDVVNETFELADAAPAVQTSSALVARTLAQLPEPYRNQAAWTKHIETPDGVVRRFVAAHAFANWHLHKTAGGLQAWLESIETAGAFLSEGASVRHADLVLRHLVQV